MEFKLEELAARLDAVLEGDPATVITGVAGLDDAGPGDLSFLANPKYAPLVAGTRASAVLVDRNFAGEADAALLRVTNPFHSMIQLVREAQALDRPAPGIHPSAIIDPSAEVDPGCRVGPLCIVEAGAKVGAGTILHAAVFVGRDAHIGADGEFYPHATVGNRVRVGDRVVVHAGAVLGSDGFGFIPGKDGHEKVPQVGTVVVEDDVEIGANVTVDRGTLGETRIGRGVKIDNLVHIAHNVTVGENTLLVAQVGISGSTSIGADVTIAGQAGVGGHLRVGDGAVIAARAGVTKSVPAGNRVSDYPAINHDRARRLQVYYRRLPDLFDTVKELKKRIRELEAERENIL